MSVTSSSISGVCNQDTQTDFDPEFERQLLAAAQQRRDKQVDSCVQVAELVPLGSSRVAPRTKRRPPVPKRPEDIYAVAVSNLGTSNNTVSDLCTSNNNVSLLSSKSAAAAMPLSRSASPSLHDEDVSWAPSQRDTAAVVATTSLPPLEKRLYLNPRLVDGLPLADVYQLEMRLERRLKRLKEKVADDTRNKDRERH